MASISANNNNSTFYSGTPMEPDTLTVFIKSASQQNSIEYAHIFPLTHLSDYVPIQSSFAAIPRIINAVSFFFNECSQLNLNANDPHLNGCWKAIKNFIRACVGFVPLIGNIALIIFDTSRNIVIVEPTISSELDNQQDVAGIAADGKIIFSMDLAQFRARFSRNGHVDPSSDLICLEYLCVTAINREIDLGNRRNIPEIFAELT